jgi:hypothetical protein
MMNGDAKGGFAAEGDRSTERQEQEQAGGQTGGCIAYAKGKTVATHDHIIAIGNMRSWRCMAECVR